MYELMLQLPLFQGISSERLSALIEKYPFHFLKFHSGEPVCAAGDPSTHIRFIVSGEARVTTNFSHLRVALHHTLAAPQVICADHLFGLDTTYPCDVRARGGNCGVLQLLKSDYVQMIQADKVLLFNYLNHLSNRSQRMSGLLRRLRLGTPAERLAVLLRTLTTPASTDVALSFRAKDFCTLLGASRNTLGKTLDTYADAGLIVHSTNELSVADLPRLLAAIENGLPEITLSNGDN